MQNDAYNLLNTIISALLLTLPYLTPRSISMHSICPHLKCIWNSRTEVGVGKPDRAELQFPGDMFSKHPKISLRVKCSTWWLRVSAAHAVHSVPVLLTGMVTWLPVMIFHAVELFSFLYHFHVEEISLEQCIGHCKLDGGSGQYVHIKE